MVSRVGVRPCGGEPQQCASPSGSTALLPVGGIVLVRSLGAHLLRLDHVARHDMSRSERPTDERLEVPRSTPMTSRAQVGIALVQETLAHGC